MLYNLKSNLVFKTLDRHKDDHYSNKFSEPLPDTLFMCIGKEELMNLCELFP